MKLIGIEFNLISWVVRMYTIRKKPKNRKIWSRQNCKIQACFRPVWGRYDGFPHFSVKSTDFCVRLCCRHLWIFKRGVTKMKCKHSKVEKFKILKNVSQMNVVKSHFLNLILHFLVGQKIPSSSTRY